MHTDASSSNVEQREQPKRKNCQAGESEHGPLFSAKARRHMFFANRGLGMKAKVLVRMAEDHTQTSGVDPVVKNGRNDSEPWKNHNGWRRCMTGVGATRIDWVVMLVQSRTHSWPKHSRDSSGPS